MINYEIDEWSQYIEFRLDERQPLKLTYQHSQKTSHCID